MRISHSRSRKSIALALRQQRELRKQDANGNHGDGRPSWALCGKRDPAVEVREQAPPIGSQYGQRCGVQDAIFCFAELAMGSVNVDCQ